MTTFDYSKRIILKNWKEFLALINEEDVIHFYCSATSSGEFLKSELRLLFDPSIGELIEDKDILKLFTSEYELIFNGSDFKWWCQDNRADKMFSIRTKSDRQKTDKQQDVENNEMHVKICELKDNNPVNIAEFIGSKKECIQFINQRYYVYVLRARSNDAVRLDINDSGWKTFTKLKEEGVIE